MLSAHGVFRLRRWPIAALFLAAVATLAASQPARAAGLLVADGGFGGVLEIKQHDVKVTINNGVAITEVEQVFLNKEQRIVEALYTFPVPKGASVSNFSMWIGGKEMIGEVVEKERARQIYESYKQTRRDPGLLEQVDYKRFEMRIFPIPAGAEQRVRVTYYQELDFDHDWATYVYPLATVTQKNLDAKSRERFTIAFDVRSETPVTELKSPSHGEEFAIAQHGSANYWQASLEAREGNLNRDVVLAYHLERPRTGFDLIANKQPGEDGYFQLTLTAGKELEQADAGADYVFVVDVSGSMQFDGKLGASRKSVEQFVAALGEQDQFEIITFNLQANSLFGKLSEVNDDAQQRAAEYLRSQPARGGTVLRPAVEMAYRYQQADRPLNVVVLSDGLTEQNEQRELIATVKNRPTGCTVFCVGVGNEVNRPLLTQLAKDAGGLAAFVSPGDDFSRQAEAFRRKLTRPAMTGVKLAFDGADVFDLEPQQLPNLYHGQPVRLYGRYRSGGDMKLNVTAEVQGRPIEQSVELKLPERSDDNPEIERMWAYHRVMRLMEEGRRDGNLGSLQSEIVRLCEGYSIAGEFASFIVLENDGEYQRWKIDRRNATRIVRDRKAQQQVRDQLAALRAKAQQQQGPRPANGEAEKQLALGPGNPLTSGPATDAGNNNAATNSPQTNPQPQPLPTPAANDLQLGPVDDSSPNVRRGGGNNFGGAGGGGAIDPVTALVAAGVAAAGWCARRCAAGKKLDEKGSG